MKNVSSLLLAAPVLVAIVTFLSTRWAVRRKTSGSVVTSEAKELWDANEAFQTRILGEVSVLRTNSEKLVADYQGLQKLHNACESSLEEMRLTLLKIEAKNEAAKTMADAREEANNLLLEAALARERVATDAATAKDEVAVAAARARTRIGTEASGGEPKDD